MAGTFLGVLLVCGCGGSGSGVAEDKSDKDAAARAKNAVKVDPFLNQSFDEATVTDPPPDQTLPDKTMADKSVGKIYTEVVENWKNVPFVTADGKRIQYRATLETELGRIDITFRPDIAPNHVRNFVALARAGYYDGLVFERRHYEESNVDPGATLEYVEAGCPLGTGDENYGSIGYWLKPEFSTRVKHEEGTVGAWHKEEADTAACKFYITLTRAPVMDGNWTVFGKVTRGLDVVRKIAQRPLKPDDEFKDRPLNPVVIRKVTIHTTEAAR
jgi:peptidyl-prolyl cis-trans isomerase B (cyclophilin B)